MPCPAIRKRHANRDGRLPAPWSSRFRAIGAADFAGAAKTAAPDRARHRSDRCEITLHAHFCDWSGACYPRAEQSSWTHPRGSLRGTCTRNDVGSRASCGQARRRRRARQRRRFALRCDARTNGRRPGPAGHVRREPHSVKRYAGAPSVIYTPHGQGLCDIRSLLTKRGVRLWSSAGGHVDAAGRVASTVRCAINRRLQQSGAGIHVGRRFGLLPAEQCIDCFAVIRRTDRFCGRICRAPREHGEHREIPARIAAGRRQFRRTIVINAVCCFIRPVTCRDRSRTIQHPGRRTIQHGP